MAYRLCMPGVSILDVGERLGRAASSPSRVIAFGRHVTDEVGSRSHLDLLVIQREIEDRNAEFVRLRRALRGLGLSIGLVLVSEAEASRWADVPGTLINEALNQGREIARP